MSFEICDLISTLFDVKCGVSDSDSDSELLVLVLVLGVGSGLLVALPALPCTYGREFGCLFVGLVVVYVVVEVS